MTFKNQWHYLDFRSHCISFSSLLVLTTDCWVVIRPKRTKKRQAITYIWIIWVAVEYQRRTNNINKHPTVLLFALEHFLWINGEKVFEVYKGSTFCNGSKFGVFICHSRSGNTRTPSPRSSYLSTTSFSDTLSCCHSNLLQKSCLFVFKLDLLLEWSSNQNWWRSLY